MIRTSSRKTKILYRSTTEYYSFLSNLKLVVFKKNIYISKIGYKTDHKRLHANLSIFINNFYQKRTKS